MFTFLCPTPLLSQKPSTPSTAVDQFVHTDLSLSSSPTPRGQISLHRLREFTFTALPCPPPSNSSPKLLDLFPTKNPSLCDDNRSDTDNYDSEISDSTIHLVGQGMPEGFESRWVRKRLAVSDVNTSSRLLLSKEEIVNKYVLPSITQEQRNECHDIDNGLKVKIFDMDTRSECESILKKWRSGSYVLSKNWRSHFVVTRSLKEGDIIELSWDSKNLMFLFRKLNV